MHEESMVKDTMLSRGASIKKATLTKCSLLENVRIEANSILSETLVGRNTTIGRNCSLKNVVVDHGSVIPDNTVLSDTQWPIIDQ